MREQSLGTKNFTFGEFFGILTLNEALGIDVLSLRRRTMTEHRVY